MLYPNSNKDKKITQIRNVGPYMGLGMQLAVTILVMLFAGYKLDEYLETSPIFTLIFSLFGAFAGLYNFIKTVLNLNEKQKSEKTDK